MGRSAQRVLQGRGSFDRYRDMAMVPAVDDPSVSGARRGDPLAWADLYERYQPVVDRYLQIVDPEALDEVDAIWERAARDLDVLPEGAEPLTWLLRAVHEGSHPEPSTTASLDPVIRVMRSLEPLELDVLALRVIAGLSDEEVASVTGRPVSRVRVVGHLGFAKLLRAVEDRP